MAVITKKVKRKVLFTTDILCDICKQSCKKYEYKVDNPAREDYKEIKADFEFMYLEANWGYHSDNMDMQKWTAHVCEKCVVEKLGAIIDFKKEQKNEM